MFVKILVYGLLITFCTALNLFAQVGCGDDAYINAYVVDKAPKSLDVRDQPSVKGKILATVKTTLNDSDTGFIHVVITGFSNGWVKITSANGDEGSSFEGIGWVSANMAGWTVGPYDKKKETNKPANLYAASNSKRKIGTIPHDSEVLFTGFTCGWVKVKYKTKIGWIRSSNFCGSPVTSCS